MSLWVVVGGQYGSEGKGKVSAFITLKENIDICVRCGGPNSGHSLTDRVGKTHVLRQLPTGYMNPRTRLLIPAGALLDPVVLRSEIQYFAIPPARVGIDRNCFIIEEKDREAEKALKLRERVSSTLSGVGAAVSRRVLRNQDVKLARNAVRDYPWLAGLITEASAEVNEALDIGRSVLIEGTQGFGLSVYHSEFYPHCTSRDTTASGFLSEVGVSPRLATEIIVVLRTFPIRVAGEQAGPLKDEITWDQLQEESGYPDPITERTSVTNKIRRVGRFDWELAKKAVVMNRPTQIAINGLDYLGYRNRGISDLNSLTVEAKMLIERLTDMSFSQVSYLGTGPRLDEIFHESTRSDETLRRLKIVG